MERIPKTGGPPCAICTAEGSSPTQKSAEDSGRDIIVIIMESLLVLGGEEVKSGVFFRRRVFFREGRGSGVGMGRMREAEEGGRCFFVEGRVFGRGRGGEGVRVREERREGFF